MIEKILKTRLHNYYLELLNDAQENQDPDAGQYVDTFGVYCKCISEICCDLCGAIEMNLYAAELKEALKREVEFLEKQHELKTARQSLEKITWYRGLGELLPVLSNDDLLYVYKHSHRAASTYIDDIEDFYAVIEEMQIKYNQGS